MSARKFAIHSYWRDLLVSRAQLSSISMLHQNLRLGFTYYSPADYNKPVREVLQKEGCGLCRCCSKCSTLCEMCCEDEDTRVLRLLDKSEDEIVNAAITFVKELCQDKEELESEDDDDYDDQLIRSGSEDDDDTEEQEATGLDDVLDMRHIELVD